MGEEGVAPVAESWSLCGPAEVVHAEVVHAEVCAPRQTRRHNFNDAMAEMRLGDIGGQFARSTGPR